MTEEIRIPIPAGATHLVFPPASTSGGGNYIHKAIAQEEPLSFDPGKEDIIYSNPDCRRMTIWREFKWLVASIFLGWALRLMEKEMPRETGVAFNTIFSGGPDPKFNTVPMRKL